MPATYQIDVFHGASPTASALPTNGRFHRADTTPTTDGATTFIPIPTGGTNYSWRKSLKLNVTGAPSGSVANLRFYTDGTSWGTGVTPYAINTGTYTQASTSDNSALIPSGVDATTYTSSSPMTVNAGTVLTATTGYGTQNYVVMQIGVAATASPGTTAARTITYRVDET